jgi:hypothetical protein
MVELHTALSADDLRPGRPQPHGELTPVVLTDGREPIPPLEAAVLLLQPLAEQRPLAKSGEVHVGHRPWQAHIEVQVGATGLLELLHPDAH